MKLLIDFVDTTHMVIVMFHKSAFFQVDHQS